MVGYRIAIIFIFFISFTSSTIAGEFLHKFKKTYPIIKNKISMERTISVGLVLITLDKYRDLIPQNIIYNQVLSYSKQEPFGDNHGRSTNVHETVHGINNELRNKYKNMLKKNVNGFYAGGGWAVVLENPNITMRDIIPYIPDVVREYRYKLYFIKQLGDWNDVPTYPIDEWSAYIAGAECAVDDTKNGLLPERSDCVSGCLEFGIYCTSLAMAVKNNDNIYWQKNTQFKNIIQYFLIKSEKVFFEGKDLFPSKKQDILLENLRTHQDTKDIRNFLIEEFQGVFIN